MKRLSLVIDIIELLVGLISIPVLCYMCQYDNCISFYSVYTPSFIAMLGEPS